MSRGPDTENFGTRVLDSLRPNPDLIMMPAAGLLSSVIGLRGSVHSPFPESPVNFYQSASDISPMALQ